MNIFEKRKAQEQVEKDMRESRIESVRSKREDREIRKAQSTGRVSSFLNSRSQSNEVLRATLGVIRANDPLSQAQATVEYQKAVGETVEGVRQVSAGGSGGSASTETVLPPRPGDNEVYFLASQNTELKWEVGGVGGGGDSCVGLALYIKDSEVWIGAGTVGGQLPTGFTYSDGVRVATSGSGEVYVELTINNTTGELVSVEIDEAASTPRNTSEKFRYSLGYYEYVENLPTVTNYSCGSVDYTICRNWFTSVSPFYQVTFYRAGA